MTWSQLGLHAKPIILGNVNGFWDRFADLIEHMKDAGFVHTAKNVRPVPVDDANEILAAIDAEAERMGSAPSDMSKI